MEENMPLDASIVLQSTETLILSEVLRLQFDDRSCTPMTCWEYTDLVLSHDGLDSIRFIPCDHYVLSEEYYSRRCSKDELELVLESGNQAE
jgi:hypothetical protein